MPIYHENRNGDIDLAINVMSHYGEGNGKTKAQNKKWNGEKIYYDGGEPGVLRTLYVNITNSGVAGSANGYQNLEYAVGEANIGRGPHARLQLPSVADTIEVELDGMSEESKFANDFYNNTIYPEYNALVLVTQNAGNTNVSDGNNQDTYTTRGAVKVKANDLINDRPKAAMSEMMSMLSNTGDASSEEPYLSLSKGTMWGPPVDIQNQLLIQTDYRGEPMSREELILSIKNALPVLANIEKIGHEYRFVMPER